MYKPNESEFGTLSQSLGRAFMEDPIWTAYVPDPEERKKMLPLMFEFLMHLGNRYGEVWSPDQSLGGVAIWFPRKTADTGFFHMLFTGLVFKSLKLMKEHGKTMQKLQKEMKVISKDRRRIMKGRDYLYLTCIGVDPEHQGKGQGGAILKHLFDQSKKKGVPVYLETETENNVKMYKSYGFEIIEEKTFTGSGVHLWQMIRKPDSL